MRFNILVLLASLFCLCTSAYADVNIPAPKDNHGLPNPKASEQLIDQIVAVVNSEAITQTQLDQAIARMAKQIKQHGMQVPPQSVLRHQVLEQLINQSLELQLAKRAGVKTTKKQVDAAVQRILKQNKMTLQQLKAKLEKTGYTYSQFRKDLSNQIIVSQLQQAVAGKDVHITQKDIDGFLQQYNAQNKGAAQYHLVDAIVPLSDSPSAADIKKARADAVGLAKQLKSGVSFDHLPGDNNTDLGWRPLSDIPDIFAKSVQGMKEGQVAGPIRAANGFHVIQLIGYRKATRATPTRQQIENMIYQQKMQQASQKWLKKMKQGAHIKIIQQP